jgi:hypothetical protein
MARWPDQRFVDHIPSVRVVPPSRRSSSAAARPRLATRAEQVQCEGPSIARNTSLCDSGGARDARFQAGQTRVSWADALVEMAERSLDATTPERRDRFRAYSPMGHCR